MTLPLVTSIITRSVLSAYGAPCPLGVAMVHHGADLLVNGLGLRYVVTPSKQSCPLFLMTALATKMVGAFAGVAATLVLCNRRISYNKAFCVSQVSGIAVMLAVLAHSSFFEQPVKIPLTW